MEKNPGKHNIFLTKIDIAVNIKAFAAYAFRIFCFF